MTATFDFPTWGLVLTDVHAGAALGAAGGGGRPASFTFEVQGAEAHGGGRLRVLDGARSFGLPFSHARLERVSTTADAPDAIRLQASRSRPARRR